MLKIILDTNIIISFLVTDSDFVKKLIDLKNLGKLELFCSPEIFEELTKTLQKTKIKDLIKVKQKKVATFVAYYKYKIKFVRPSLKIDICLDPRDNIFLELAKAIQADYLITGDNDLLDLKKFEVTQILKPADFVDLLKI
ncbi:MAG: putative toxin-antitoxin system toxin component, PIN family [bacterium]